MPSFSLKSVDGTFISSEYFNGAKAALVIFSCNHCPYVKGSDEMLISIARNFQPMGLKVVVIILVMMPPQYPEDSFELMQKKSKDLNMPFPYLYDETQEVAKVLTPHALLNVICSMPVSSLSITVQLMIARRIRLESAKITSRPLSRVSLREKSLIRICASDGMFDKMAVVLTATSVLECLRQ